MRWSESLLALHLGLIIALLALIYTKQSTEMVFWFFYITIVLTMSILVFTAKKYRLLAIVAFDIFIYLIFTIQYPALYQVDRDTGFESLYAQELAKTGKWDPALGSGYAQMYYGYNPLIHFVLAFLLLTTTISTHLLAKFFLIVIFRVIFLLLVFRVFQLFLRDKYQDISYFALLIYLITPRLRILYISRRFMAAIMILFAIICLLQARKSQKKMLWNILFIVFSFLVVVSDHTLSLLFGIFLFGCLLFYAALYFLPRRIFPELAREKALAAMFFRFVIYIVFWLSWNLFVSPIILMGDLGYLSDLVNSVSSITLKVPEATGILSYSMTQQWFIYLSQGLLVLVAVVAFLLYLSKQYKAPSREDFLVYFSLFSYPAVALTLYMIKTEWVVLSNVTLWFFLIPPSMFFGLSLYSVKRLRSLLFLAVSFVAIVLIFVGGLVLNYHPNVLFGRSDIIVELPEYKNQELVESAKWLATYSQTSSPVIGDRSVFDVYSAYYGFVVTPVDIAEEVYTANQTELEKRFLMRDVYFGAYLHTAERSIPRFIVFNKDLLSHPSYHFHLTEDILTKFEKTDLLRRIYEDDKIIIYENEYYFNSSSASFEPTVNRVE